MLAAAAAGDRVTTSRCNGAAGAFLSVLQQAFTHALRRQALAGPIIADSDALLDYLHLRLAHGRVEQLLVLFLDAANRLLAEESIGAGSASGVVVDPRQVLQRALELGASGMILVHNHPSGSTRPSAADIHTTRRVVEAARALDISVHDHVIVGATGWTSFRAMGLIGEGGVTGDAL